MPVHTKHTARRHLSQQQINAQRLRDYNHFLIGEYRNKLKLETKIQCANIPPQQPCPVKIDKNELSAFIKTKADEFSQKIKYTSRADERQKNLSANFQNWALRDNAALLRERGFTKKGEAAKSVFQAWTDDANFSVQRQQNKSGRQVNFEIAVKEDSKPEAWCKPFPQTLVHKLLYVPPKGEPDIRKLWRTGNVKGYFSTWYPSIEKQYTGVTFALGGTISLAGVRSGAELVHGVSTWRVPFIDRLKLAHIPRIFLDPETKLPSSKMFRTAASELASDKFATSVVTVGCLIRLAAWGMLLANTIRPIYSDWVRNGGIFNPKTGKFFAGRNTWRALPAFTIGVPGTYIGSRIGWAIGMPLGAAIGGLVAGPAGIVPGEIAGAAFFCGIGNYIGGRVGFPIGDDLGNQAYEAFTGDRRESYAWDHDLPSVPSRTPTLLRATMTSSR